MPDPCTVDPAKRRVSRKGTKSHFLSTSSHAPLAPTPWSRALARFCWPRFAAGQPCGRALPTALGRRQLWRSMLFDSSTFAEWMRTPQITACAAHTGAWRWRTIQTRAEAPRMQRISSPHEVERVPEDLSKQLHRDHKKPSVLMMISPFQVSKL